MFVEPRAVYTEVKPAHAHNSKEMSEQSLSERMGLERKATQTRGLRRLWGD